MEFEFVENFYDTIKSRARTAALRQKSSSLDSDENKKKRKTIRRNNLKNKAKTSLKTKGKVRKKRKTKGSELSPTLKKERGRNSNSNKKTTPSPKKKLVPSNNDIDEEEAAYILSTISQRSFDSFYNRFPTTIDNKIEIPIIGYEPITNRVTSDQPYSHILLDHNYWSLNKQPEIIFHAAKEEVKVEEKIIIKQLQPPIEDVKEEIINITNEVKSDEQQPEVNNNLAESISSIVKCPKNNDERKIEEVKKKSKCKKILSRRKVGGGGCGKKKRPKQKLKKKKATISNGINITATEVKCQIPEIVVENGVVENSASTNNIDEKPVKLEPVKIDDEKPSINNENENLHEVEKEEEKEEVVKVEENQIETDKSKNEIIPKELDTIKVEEKVETNQIQNSPIKSEIKKEMNDDIDDIENDEQSWNLISDFHGIILEKLTSNNVRFFSDASISETSSTSTSISIVGSVNNYSTSSDSKSQQYTPIDSYNSSNRDYNCRSNSDSIFSPNNRKAFTNYRVQDPRFKYENNYNYRRKENFHRHHSYSEGMKQTYASYKAQKTMEQRQTFNNNVNVNINIDSGNHHQQQQRQPVSVFELPVQQNGGVVSKIDLLPIIEKKEFVRSKSIADPRLTSNCFDSDKSPNPKKKVKHCKF